MVDTHEHLHQYGRMAISRLYNAPAEKIVSYDIAEMNLISACGLPGTEDLCMAKALQTLDEWAAHIRKQTARNLPHYHANRAQFKSRARFNMGTLIQTLRRDFGIHYNPDRIATPDNFDDPADSFIHGLVGPRRSGTCASIPVLLTAIGRRLGYPLKLVLAPRHCFCRWETPEERFNFDYHEQGFNSSPDEYYHEHPMKWSPALHDRERIRPTFLISLTPQQELAHFAFTRASQLDVAGRRKESLESLRVAYTFWPTPGHGYWMTHMLTKVMYPDRDWPRNPCEETAGKTAFDRLRREKGAVMVDNKWMIAV